MNKKTIIQILTLLLLVVIFVLIARKRSASLMMDTTNAGQNDVVAKLIAEPVAPADEIEVVNFFGTQRCVSCLTIGKFTKKTLETKFASELESGQIVFKEINVEFPENRDIVMKYQARGSSLFINAIRGNQDDISEDVTVWRLVNNEEQFTSYLENKLNKLLGR